MSDLATRLAWWLVRWYPKVTRRPSFRQPHSQGGWGADLKHDPFLTFFIVFFRIVVPSHLTIAIVSTAPESPQKETPMIWKPGFRMQTWGLESHFIDFWSNFV